VIDPLIIYHFLMGQNDYLYKSQLIRPSLYYKMKMNILAECFFKKFMQF